MTAHAPPYLQEQSHLKKERAVWRIPNRIVHKTMMLCVLSIPVAILVWTYLNYRFITTAYVKGAEIPQLKFALLAMTPLCLALAYSAWQIVRHSPDAQASLRHRLKTGWVFGFDSKRRCLAAFDRLIRESEARQLKHEAAKAAIAELPDWKWVVKPVLIGFLAAFAASPLLAIAPIFIDSMSARSSVVLGGVIWGAATLAYVVVRWLGILDERDRPRKKRSSRVNAQRRISDEYAPGLNHAESRLSAPGVTANAQTVAKESPMGSDTEFAGEIRKALPAPPQGFDWVIFHNAVFLRPAHWNVVTKHVPSIAELQGRDIYAASPVPFSETKPFDTGLTLEILSGMNSPGWVSAKHAFARYINGYLRDVADTDVLLASEKQQRGIDTVIVRFRDTRLGLPPEIVHKFAHIHHDLEVVHVYTFETPESLWAEHWARYGTPILSNVTMVVPRNFSVEASLR